MMKKSLLALAVAALSANAFAVDLSATTSDAVNYASEITLPTTLTDTTSNALDVSVKLGFSATASVKRWVRFDLTNAQFTTAVNTTDLTTTATWDADSDPITPPIAVALSPVVSTGGTVNSSSVVIEITPVANLANDAILKLALANIRATGGEASIQYRLYETGVDASNGTGNTLANKSGKLFGFASGLEAKIVTKGANDKIDVAQESKYFSGATADDSTIIGTLSVKPSSSAVYAKDGIQVTNLNQLIATGSKIEVSGDFSAGKKTNGALVKAAAVLDTVAEAKTEITATKATYTIDTASIDNKGLTFNVDGQTAMVAQSFTAKFVPVVAEGYTISSIDLGELGKLEKNGSSKLVNFNLKPKSQGGAYENYLRISNTSNIAGKFFITVIADDGSNISLALSDVASQPAELAARASTTQLSIEDIYSAAVAKGFALAGQGKIRLLVEGEVPSLDVQSYTTSKDGNSFNTF